MREESEHSSALADLVIAWEYFAKSGVFGRRHGFDNEALVERKIKKRPGPERVTHTVRE